MGRAQTSQFPGVFISLPLAFFLISQSPLPVALSAEILYVKSSGTKVLEKGSANARVMEVLDEGVAVQVLKESRLFYKIALPKGGEGWVFKFKLTKTQPAKTPVKGNLVVPFDEKEDIPARESDSGSSIRARDPSFKELGDAKDAPKTEHNRQPDKGGVGDKK